MNRFTLGIFFFTLTTFLPFSSQDAHAASSKAKAPSMKLFAGTYQGVCLLTSITGKDSGHNQIRITVSKKGIVSGAAAFETTTYDSDGLPNADKQITTLTAAGKVSTPAKKVSRFGSVKTSQITAKSTFSLSDGTVIKGTFTYMRDNHVGNVFIGNGKYLDYLGSCALNEVG